MGSRAQKGPEDSLPCPALPTTLVGKNVGLGVNGLKIGMRGNFLTLLNLSLPICQMAANGRTCLPGPSEDEGEVQRASTRCVLTRGGGGGGGCWEDTGEVLYFPG